MVPPPLRPLSSSEPARPQSPENIPLPPPRGSGSEGARGKFDLDLSKPMGMHVNSECVITEVHEKGQTEAAGIKKGCVIIIVDDTIVKSLKAIKKALKACRDRGEESCEIEYRAAKPPVPLRPFLLTSLAALEVVSPPATRGSGGGGREAGPIVSCVREGGEGGARYFLFASFLVCSDPLFETPPRLRRRRPS